MTIKRRINLVFIAIGTMFVLNLVIYFINDQRRVVSADSLRRAISRQPILTDVQQNLTNLQRQVALLSQVMSDLSAGADPADLQKFRDEIARTEQRVADLETLEDPDQRPRITEFRKLVQELGQSWIVFYENFGVHHPKAVMELAMHGDPLSRRIMGELLPGIMVAERDRTATASQRFFADAALVQRLALGIFAFSTTVGMVVGWLVLADLVRGLNRLREGAEEIGRKHLEFRIDLTTKDELGEVASAFNGMAANLSSARDELHQRQAELEAARQRAEALLLNILPARAAQELTEKGSVDPRYFEDVTIMFTDFVGFTLSTEKLAAEDLVHALHDYFTAFDQISRRYGLEKLKTIGDSYMCLSGLPVRNPAHPVDVVMAAMEMLHAVQERKLLNPQGWGVRIGIHTGPVVAGVVGIEKFAFDIWGDSVNFSSRMESSGAPNRINLSERTWSRVKDFFECEHRGRVQTKDKREVDMYFVNGVLPSLLDDSGVAPPAAFARRYRTYFEHDPPAFPGWLSAAGPGPEAQRGIA
ncbi:MAG TPA: adenylate/guanylate cyclase domain-containing protein [Bryobacteraceae bacterium]|nr:adenylate/guanylate cyclase domain-containing protein [Bryobacteraceae bacterium]